MQVNAVVATIGEANEKVDNSPAVQSANSPAPLTETNTSASDERLIEIVMPQMGESIFEGTITKWLKQVGDAVERDEPLFEISTDKVDAEIPAPASGVLREIKAAAGAVVQVHTTVALIGNTGSIGGVAKPAQGAPETKEPKASPVPSKPVEQPVGQASAASLAGEKLRSSPLVRKMVKEHGIDLSRVEGTGSAGRITKEDVLDHLQKSRVSAAAELVVQVPVETKRPPQPSVAPAVPALALGSAKDQLVPMTRMRSIIAQRMVESKRTNAHVHTVFKIDMTRIVRLREKEKTKYEQRNGVKLTYMPFIASAITATLRQMPIMNASIEGEAIQYHSSVNLGIAVALDWGLIVPVLKQAEEKSFLGIARGIADLAERARNKKLKPDEVGTSTFTLTNAGIYGEQFGTPIINMPESAILGIGGLFKEPAVMTDEHGTDSIAIRHVIHLTLGFDHRVIDGADAGKFMAEIKKNLERWNESIE